jgi:sugar phosphate isomerase/epimerase
MKSRRSFLKASVVGATGAAFASGVHASPARDTANAKHPIKLGVASYSLRKLSRSDAIAAVNAMGTPYICIKSFHLPYDVSDEECAAARREFADAGLTIVGGGNNNIREDSDEGVGMFFEYAKKAGMPLLVIAPTFDVLPRVERFVKQYDIKVAIHNHGPEDAFFPAPSDAIEAIKDMDPRVGLCVDIGHTTRTGADVVQEIADAGDRVLDVHVKDLADLRTRGSDCIVGEGAMPVAEIFQQLKKMRYEGYVNLEYEIDPDDPVPGMLRSFAYMRGVLTGLETTDMV